MEISSASTSSDEGEVPDFPQESTANQELAAESDQDLLYEPTLEQQGGGSRGQSSDADRSRSEENNVLAGVPISAASHVAMDTSGDNETSRPESSVNAMIKEEIQSPLTMQSAFSQSGHSIQGAVSSAPIVLDDDDDEDDYEPPESISPAPPVSNDVKSVNSFSPPSSEVPMAESSQPVPQSELQTISDNAPTNNEAPQNLKTFQQFETIAPDVQEVGLAVILCFLTNVRLGAGPDSTSTSCPLQAL